MSFRLVGPEEQTIRSFRELGLTPEATVDEITAKYRALGASPACTVDTLLLPEALDRLLS